MNRAYKKSITREILSSKARFLSILAIILLGVAIYVGIKSSGPDLKYSIDEFFKEQNLMDSKIISTLGLNEKDLKLLENNDKISDYEATRSVDINLTNINSVVKFMEYNPNSNKMNKFIVKEGRLPQNSGEIALDEIALRSNKNLKIGDTYTIKSDEDLDSYFNRKTFKIVGFVQSPMYIENTSRGTTNVGKGSIDYFAVVNSADMCMDVYTEIYVKFKNVENLVSYSDEYENKMEENNNYLEKLYSSRAIDRIEEIKSEALEEINKAYKEIEDGESELNKAQKELNNGKAQLLDGKKEYEQGLKEYKQEIKNGELKLSQGQTALENGQKELDKQKDQLLEGESQLSLAKEQLDNTKQFFLSQGIDPDIEIDESNTLLPNELVAGILKYQDGLKEYNTQLANINQGKIQLEEAQQTLNKSKEELQKGKVELEEGRQKGQLELSKAKKELEKAEQEIINGQNEIDENRQKLIDGRKEIDDEKEKLKQLDDSKYYFFGRVDNPGYSTYKGSIDSLDKIALVFPVFFFLVAALICLTTMTRMVEENRIEIGTLKAIGYTDLEISRKFVVYAALASIAGCIVGILVGSILLPNVINIAYSSTFTLPQVKIKYYPSYIIQSLVASLVCTVGAALIVLKEELRDNPSNLMRSKAPKLGKKILLERITPLWSRLNFNQKVTFRNLFRYKQRMLMTILGVSGCMALLVTGMALEESNSSLTNIQFDKLINYDAIAIFKDKSTEKEDTQYNESLKNLKGYDSSLNIYQESVTFSKEGMSKQTATMYVPQNKEDLNNYILLNDRKSKEKYNLSDDGVIITEKLAKLLDVSDGDNVVFKDSNNKEHSVKVDHIVENYLGHYIYLSPKYYEEIFKSKPVYNAQLLKFNSKVGNQEKAAEKLMQNDKVVNVTLTSKIKSMSESADLGLVVIVIIIASGSLAFVVLYNLININVSERIREISTIKVLGFHDREVDMYIFRENIILTILGILTGTFMGNILYLFLISTAEMDNMMMIPTVSTTSYVISGLITMVFAILVMIMMHFKLKNINMIDALKSIE